MYVLLSFFSRSGVRRVECSHQLVCNSGDYKRQYEIENLTTATNEANAVAVMVASCPPKKAPTKISNKEILHTARSYATAWLLPACVVPLALPIELDFAKEGQTPSHFEMTFERSLTNLTLSNAYSTVLYVWGNFHWRQCTIFVAFRRLSAH